jgi:hypothetical protein
MSSPHIGSGSGIFFRLFVTLGVFSVISVIAVSAFAGSNNSARIREIEEWVDAQGTYCIDDGMGGCVLFVPPFENYLGESSFPPPPGVVTILSSFDYAGIAERKIIEEGGDPLGTTFEGHIRERPLKDGRAECRVNLRTRNALCWANECDMACDFATSPMLFGARSTEVLGGMPATLGEINLTVLFINTAMGAPMPDIFKILVDPDPGQELLWFALSATANGPLREAYGVPDGTPGKMTVRQTGNFIGSGQGALADGFPVEHINLQVVGGGTMDGSPAGVAPLWTVSPNPLHRGTALSFSYRVPDGGADVSVGLFSVAGRRVATLADGFQSAGSHTLNWSGHSSMPASGIYFLRAKVGTTTNTYRVVVLD